VAPSVGGYGADRVRSVRPYTGRVSEPEGPAHRGLRQSAHPPYSQHQSSPTSRPPSSTDGRRWSGRQVRCQQGVPAGDDWRPGTDVYDRAGPGLGRADGPEGHAARVGCRWPGRRARPAAIPDRHCREAVEPLGVRDVSARPRRPRARSDTWSKARRRTRQPLWPRPERSQRARSRCRRSSSPSRRSPPCSRSATNSSKTQRPSRPT
jgi:hypothetical protein